MMVITVLQAQSNKAGKEEKKRTPERATLADETLALSFLGDSVLPPLWETAVSPGVCYRCCLKI